MQQMLMDPNANQLGNVSLLVVMQKTKSHSPELFMRGIKSVGRVYGDGNGGCETARVFNGTLTREKQD